VEVIGGVEIVGLVVARADVRRRIQVSNFAGTYRQARQTHPKFDDYNQSGIPGGHRCVVWSALQSVRKATVSQLVGGGRQW
jgi:hypothetical protein